MGSNNDNSFQMLFCVNKINFQQKYQLQLRWLVMYRRIWQKFDGNHNSYVKKQNTCTCTHNNLSQYELSLSTFGQCTLNLKANRILYVILKIVLDKRKQYLNNWGIIEEIWPLTWVYSHFVTFLLHRTYSRLPSWSVRQAESLSMCPLTVNLKNWRKHGRLYN